MISIFQDREANHGNPKGLLVTALFRMAHMLRMGPKWLFPLAAIYGIFYRVVVEWFLCIELPWKTKVGPGLRLEHGQALVVNDATVFGQNCTLRNGVTIGIKQLSSGGFSGAPRFGNRVDVGANATIIGPISIGDDAVIGAGAVVVKDVPPGAVVVGNPARILRIKPGIGNPATSGEIPSDSANRQV